MKAVRKSSSLGKGFFFCPRAACFIFWALTCVLVTALGLEGSLGRDIPLGLGATFGLDSVFGLAATFCLDLPLGVAAALGLATTLAFGAPLGFEIAFDLEAIFLLTLGVTFRSFLVTALVTEAFFFLAFSFLSLLDFMDPPSRRLTASHIRRVIKALISWGRQNESRVQILIFILLSTK
jgi:hypothetical protein